MSNCEEFVIIVSRHHLQDSTDQLNAHYQDVKFVASLPIKFHKSSSTDELYMFHVSGPRNKPPVPLHPQSISLSDLNDYWFDPERQEDTYASMRDQLFGTMGVSSNTRSKRSRR